MNESINTHKPVSTAIPQAHPSRLFPVPRLSTLVTVGIVVLLIYAFFAKITMQFYASAVFTFYALTKSMWISVVMLGIFQTLLMIPFRVINLLKSANIKEFQDKLKQIRQEEDQQYLLKKSVRQGRRVALFYLVNFFVQLISYTSIGRLFLTDFYSKPLDPKLLYDFVPYPDYPIKDRFFKIPYPWFSDTINLGMRWVLIAWGVIIGIQAVVYIGKGVMRRMKVKMPKSDGSTQSKMLSKVIGLISGRLVILAILAFIIIRHFPVEWSLRIFSGDVSVPNRRFNTITAIVTFGTLVWINMPRIKKKVDLAREAGMEEAVIARTEKQLFRESLQVAAFVGLGAFFITNQIPSAFELSIFTLEIISLFSPLTLDRIILSSRGAGVALARVESLDTPVNGEEESGVQKTG